MVQINGMEVGTRLFPNNERIFEALKYPEDFDEPFYIDFKFETDMDIWKLIAVKSYLNDTYPRCYVYLNMPYIPYSRMDRRTVDKYFSLKYFCKLINALAFDKVIVLDPHSNVSEGLLDNLTIKDVSKYIWNVICAEEPDYVFYPDNGALKRYSETITLPYNVGVFYGSKKRNLTTGKIEKFELVNAPDLSGKKVLIIDDLCSRGGTFVASANLLKEAGATRITLYVSHCENTVFDGELLKPDSSVDMVYTTDSILSDFHSPKLTCVHSNFEKEYQDGQHLTYHLY
jgi:ribose-phosphate pyrophosphokinase